jgi:hypothetical protein
VRPSGRRRGQAKQAQPVIPVCGGRLSRLAPSFCSSSPPQ